MPIDRADPEFIAAATEFATPLVTAAKLALQGEHNGVLTALSADRDAKALAATEAAALATTTQAALDALTATHTGTASELATLKTAAENAAKTADAAKIAALPEAVRRLVPAGLAGDALATWCAEAGALLDRPAPRPGEGGVPLAVATAEQLAWAATMFDGPVTDHAKIIAAFNKIGPGRKLAATSAARA